MENETRTTCTKERNRTEWRTSAANERKQQKETIEPIDIGKLQENNKWVSMEDKRRWTYMVDDPWSVSRHLKGGEASR